MFTLLFRSINMASTGLKELIEQKTTVESELQALYDVLRSHNTDMDSELVDAEGYPRADVDIITVRKTRVRILYLRNDLKKLMSQIEAGLVEVHKEARENSDGATLRIQSMNLSSNAKQLPPILRVNQVTADSPAEKAGLCVEDLITQFGSITSDNFVDLKSIGALVQHSKGKEVTVKILRGEEAKALKLVPNTWSGKGLLGCNVVPFK